MNLLMSDSEELNPFIPNSKDYVINDEKFDFTPFNLYKHFSKVYIFCKLNDTVEYQKLLNSRINRDDLNNILKMFTIYETGNNIIYNKTLNNNLVIIDKEIIQTSNHFNYYLEDKILVLPIFDGAALFLDIVPCCQLIIGGEHPISTGRKIAPEQITNSPSKSGVKYSTL